MKVNIICLEDQMESVRKELDDLGIEILSQDNTMGTFKVETSEAGFEQIAEIAGVVSAAKDSWMFQSDD